MQGREKPCPCRECERRTSECRKSCEAWQEWDREHVKRREALWQARNRDQCLGYYSSSTVTGKHRKRRRER